MKIIAPLPPNIANARMHWRVKLKQKHFYWSRLGSLWLTRRIPRPGGNVPQRVRLSATLYVHSYMDDDNAMHRLKWLLDWLVGQGYFADDTRENIKWAGLPEQVIDRKNPRVELTIEAA